MGRSEMFSDKTKKESKKMKTMYIHANAVMGSLPGGEFHGGEQVRTLPGGGFHGGEQVRTLPGGGFHGGERK